MKKIIIFLAAVLMANTGLWAETQPVSYSYPVYNTADDPTSGIKEWKTASVEATVVTDASEPVTWNAGWYVVTGTDVTLPKGAICNGDVRLILADGAKLTATGWVDLEDEIGWPSYAGIQVSGDGNSLTIYGQTVQTGQLEANGGDGAAGIGGGNEGSGSNITINGGIVTANGKNGAGIGGGDGGAGFNITINGGTVTANGGGSGAGIGGGRLGNGYNITINGGMITATSNWGAGIGNGYMARTSASNIKVVTKCIVKSIGEFFTEEIGADRSDETDIANDLAGKKYVTIETLLSIISTNYVDENGEAQEVDAFVIETSGTPVTWGVPVAWGEERKTTWYVVNDANEIHLQGAICQGDVRLILADGAILTATGKDAPDYTPGIQVSGDGNSLTIYSQANKSGQLIAIGGEWAAGIGGGNEGSGSNITINGGIVAATGGDSGAGIGGGANGYSSNITINGGTVTANGGGDAAGIGGGCRSSGSNITINGGIVTANGGYHASGIGGGWTGSGYNITINGGTVTAYGGGDASGIGGGYSSSSNNIRVATTLLVKADGNNPPTEEIEHDNGGDIAGKLRFKRYATITSILPFWNSANAAIDAAFKGITNENMKAIATTAKKNIEAATTTMAIGSIKEKALADLQYVLSFYNAGKAEALGSLGEKQDGPAVEVIDQDDKSVILYNPKKVNFIKVGE